MTTGMVSLNTSIGDHDNGVGEQEDVQSALKVLENLGIKSIDLAGYSFGAWVDARGLDSFEQVDRMIMVSPPVGLLDFEALTSNDKVRLVIAGSLDDIAPVNAIKGKSPSGILRRRFMLSTEQTIFIRERLTT